MKRAVVDQPGLKIIILGLVVSIIIGLSIKAQISPRKIKKRLDQAISRLQPDVKIDFKSVEIKLSDWGWPQPYLEVHEIRVSPVKAICDESQIFVETLSFPLSWNLFFDSKKVIRSLRISQLEIRLSEFKNCFTSVTSNESVSESLLRQGLTQVFSAPNAEQLRELKIDRIKILSKDNYQMPLYLQAAVFEFSYARQMLSKIALKAQTVFYNDNQKQLFKIKSDLNLNFEKQNSGEISILGQLSGKLIDRDYRIHFDYKPEVNSFYFIFEGQKISVKSLFKLFHFEHKELTEPLKNELFTFFMSVKGVGFFNLNKNKSENIQLSEFKIESESGLLSSSQIEINSLQPFEIRKAQIQVKNLDISTFFKKLLNDKILNSHIETAGRFNGEIILTESKEAKMFGIVQDLKFYLSPANQKWPQLMNEMSLDFSMDENSKKLTLDHMIMNSKPIRGLFRYQDVQNQKPLLKLELSGDILTQDYLNEMWGVESLTDLNMSLSRESDFFVYEIISKKLNFNGLKLSDVRYVLKETHESKLPQVQFKVAHLSWGDSTNTQLSEFADFYLKNVSLKKIDSEGVNSDGRFIILINSKMNKTKSDKLKFDLDFRNKKFISIE